MSDYHCGENCSMTQSVTIPMELYQSSMGRYFIGYADELIFGNGTGSWARLYNPPCSGVNLYVNVWTVTAAGNTPFRADFWFNPDTPGTPEPAGKGTTTNLTICPPPTPVVCIEKASVVCEKPCGGALAFVRTGEPGATQVDTENGKLIFPPGGSFLIYLSAPEGTTKCSTGRIAFGWWEEKTTCGKF